MNELVHNDALVVALVQDGEAVIGANGLQTSGGLVIQQRSVRVSRLRDPDILVGWAGHAMAGFVLLDELMERISEHNNTCEALLALAKADARKDAHRRGGSLMLATPAELLVFDRAGQVLKPEHGYFAIGAGAQVAMGALHALSLHSPPATDLVQQALAITADLVPSAAGQPSIVSTAGTHQPDASSFNAPQHEPNH